MNKSNGKIFITGASGFLGSVLTRKLIKQKQEVRLLLRKTSSHPFLKDLNTEVTYGDVLDRDSLEKGMHGCTNVIHIAGMVSYYPRDKKMLYDVNVEGTRNICEAALSSGISKLTYVSSTAAIGIPENPEKPLDENAIFGKKWKKIPYMETKREAEEIARNYCDKGMDIRIANPSTFIGAGDTKLNNADIFINIQNGKLRAAPPGGNGVIAIDDCVDGILKVMEKGKPGERYILNSDNISLITLFNMVAVSLGQKPITKQFNESLYYIFSPVALVVQNLFRLFGQKPPITQQAVKIGWSHRYFDSSKARKKLGWKPAVSIEQACMDAVKFYREIGVLK